MISSPEVQSTEALQVMVSCIGAGLCLGLLLLSPLEVRAELGLERTSGQDLLRPHYVQPRMSEIIGVDVAELEDDAGNAEPDRGGALLVNRVIPDEAADDWQRSTRIVLHTQDLGDTLPDTLVRMFRAIGAVDVEIRGVDFAISKNQVRFFHWTDLSKATSVADELETVFDEIEMRDFTTYSPAPSLGLVEIWVRS